MVKIIDFKSLDYSILFFRKQTTYKTINFEKIINFQVKNYQFLLLSCRYFNKVKFSLIDSKIQHFLSQRL
jgi:hypothetical protein